MEGIINMVPFTILHSSPKYYSIFVYNFQHSGLTKTVSNMQVQIINGPNLNLLGSREPGIYGDESFLEFLDSLKSEYPNIEISYFQSNIEGEIINQIQETGFSYDGIILNAGGYTHTSVAIRDAIKAVKTPVVEVHISNVYAREEFRHKSMLTAVCIGVIAGFGLNSYKLAIESLIFSNK